MVQCLEAVYEDGILRPLQPLHLDEQQRVRLTVSDLSESTTGNPRLEEQKWIAENEALYAGQWVALDGSQLISHGPKARAVRDEARAKGVHDPLMYRVPAEPELPCAGWL